MADITAESPRGEDTYYLHERTGDLSGDQTTHQFYFDTTDTSVTDDGDEDLPDSYVTVHNVKTDIPGLVPGSYIL